MNTRKWTALLLSLVLLLGVLPGAALAADGDEAPQVSATAKLEAQLDAGANRYDPDTVVASVDGVDVTWRLFYYLLASTTSQLIQYTGGIPDFTTDVGEGKTLQESMHESLEARLKYYVIPRVKAAEADLTETVQAEVDTMWKDMEEQYGGVDALMEELEQAYMDEPTFRSLLEANAAFNAIMESTYGANGEKLSDEDVIAWADDNNFLRAKHILFLTQNDDGSAMTDEQKADVRAEAEKTLEELRALEFDREAMLARFDELMLDADDPGMTQFPDGYTFTENQMVQEFEDATRALEEYAVSDIVESSYGFHIILRLPLDPECATMSRDSGTGLYMTLRADAANELFNNMLLDWIETGTVEWKDGFETLNYDEVFALTDEEITALPTVAPTAEPTAAPEETAAPQDTAEPEKTGGNVWMYVAIAAIVIAAALAAVLLGKKKSAAPEVTETAEAPAEETAEETTETPAGTAETDEPENAGASAGSAEEKKEEDE